VFSNPPYIEGRRGFPSPSPEKNIAKHEIKCDIMDVMNAAAGALKRKGRACFVFPMNRRRAFLDAAGRCGLRVRRERFVLPRRGAEPRLFLAECAFGAGRKRVEPPLALLRADGSPTAEAERIYAGTGHA
jgi:tRNA1Val (adenine37-N6)-methyltransferase